MFVVLGALMGAAGALVLVRPAPVVQTLSPPKDPVPAVTYQAVSFAELSGWGEDRLSEAVPALARSCAALSDNDEPQRLGDVVISAADRKSACDKILSADAGVKNLRAAIEAALQPYAVIPADKSEGLFTGYYEATLRGSPTRDDVYQYPLYGVPKTLITVALKDFLPPAVLEGGDVPRTVVGRLEGQKLSPFYTRAEIDLGQSIAQDSDVIAWIDDPVDVHVLHIQGSGQVMLPDGSMMRVGFAGHNGHAFRGLGRILIDEGVLPQGAASMIAVRDWLKQNPKRAQELMAQNARYIFFRRNTGEGPIGASGVALTPGRSLAVDPRYVPLGSLLWLETADPDRLALRRLMVAQDTGAAILGTVRGDYFWGAGEAAFAKAARMRSPGRYVILAPKTAAPIP
jgi:membrane-bound lytic murein transglycosylase A